jgi:uroporphyrinogen decarboxylase
VVTSGEEIDRLINPTVGDKRTSIHLQTAQNLVSRANGIPVLGGVIGPFSLAGRLFGVSEILELSLTDPNLAEQLLQKATRFLIKYVQAFRDQGVDGVIMAEPAAGLLSPRGLAKYSSAFVKEIVDKTQTDSFTILLHNCGAKIAHLPKILEAGAEIFHFGAPMDMSQAITQVGSEVILGGNLDPTAVFHSGTTAEVETQTSALMNLTSPFKNFIISSGCDIPPHTPVENLDAFYRAVREYTV